MKGSPLFIIFFCFIGLLSKAQYIKGKVLDKTSDEPLAGVSITIYKKNSFSGLVSNKEGGFLLAFIDEVDSLKFSMIGYESVVLLRSEISISPLTIAMSIRAIQMGEVVINSMSAIDIVRKAIQSSLALLPDSNHETKLFYRETIKDSNRYFSIAEAIFRSQYFESKK